ncbi:MAG: hypothetical protein F7B06_07515 [Opitutae bacterium]|nr:hypothetical protein [Opitutae bacterium]
MIGVLADDYTGAAEIAGIGLRYGLRVAYQVALEPVESVDLLIIATDLRTLPGDAAVAECEAFTGKLAGLGPEIIYKKTDSALRGNVLVELEAMLRTLNVSRALLLPANPGLGRTIRDGHYFLNGVRLDRTAFFKDPDYRHRNSEVLGMLGESDGTATRYLRLEDADLAAGVNVGETLREEDLTRWVELLDEATLPAGGSEFFAHILRARGHREIHSRNRFEEEPGRTLYVCGSASQYSRAAIERAKAGGATVCEIPDELFSGRGNRSLALEKWAGQIFGRLKEENTVAVAINRPLKSEATAPGKLARDTAEVVEKVLQSSEGLAALRIEGGATFSAIAHRLGFKTFFPIREYAPGVVGMRVGGLGGLSVTVKPGSYPWPEGSWFARFAENAGVGRD